jgi:RNA:NAD 2'-phosphotransferase (TPT1/KptA family)
MPADNDPEALRVQIAGYRRMTPAAKLECVASMNRMVFAMRSARLRAKYGPDLSERELRLREAALRLPRETMRVVFGWDPRVEGY